MKIRTMAMNETYLDCRSRIIAIVKTFVRRYRTDYDETMAESDILFIKAFDTHDESKGMAFTSWMQFKIEKGLMEKLRSEISVKCRRPHHVSYSTDFLIGEDGNWFNLLEFIQDLDEDSETLIRVLFFETKTWQKGMMEHNKQSPYFIRSALRSHCRKLGWSKDRIDAAFASVTQSLETK